jgi:AsmA protein
VATSKGQGGKELDELAGLTVPVKLSGSFDALKYEVDYRAVAGDLAKSKVGEKVRDRLKGLIGR